MREGRGQTVPGGRLTCIFRHNGHINDDTADAIIRIITQHTQEHAVRRAKKRALLEDEKRRARNARCCARDKMIHARTHTHVYIHTHPSGSTVQSVPRANREQRRRVLQRRHIGLQNKARSEKRRD